MTTAWMELAKAHFSQKRHEQTDETDETPLSSVLAVCSEVKSANHPVLSSVLAVCSPEKTENLKNEKIDWQPLAARYYAHHFGCAICIAAGKGYGTRCAVGLPLWRVFQARVRAGKQQIQSA